MFPPFPALKEDWREVLAAHPRAVVFFWAAWSPPDIMFFPVLKRVAPGFEDQIAFFSADLDDESVLQLLVEAAVATNPTLLFCQHAQPRERTTGYVNEAALRQKLREWLALG